MSLIILILVLFFNLMDLFVAFQVLVTTTTLFLLAGGFDLLLVDCVVLTVLHLIDVETLEVSADAQVLEVLRAQGQLCDYYLDEVICQLQFFEHLYQVFSADGIRAIFYLLKCTLQLAWVLCCHLCNTHQPLLFFLFIQQLEIFYNFPQLIQQHFRCNRLRADIFILGLENILQESFNISRGQIERLCFHHIFEINIRENSLLGGDDIIFQILVRVPLSFHSIS